MTIQPGNRAALGSRGLSRNAVKSAARPSDRLPAVTRITPLMPFAQAEFGFRASVGDMPPTLLALPDRPLASRLTSPALRVDPTVYSDRRSRVLFSQPEPVVKR